MGLSDRDYMRPAGKVVRRPFVWTTTRVLIALNVGVFVLQGLLEVFGATRLLGWFILSLPGIEYGMVWTLVTYSFFHANFWHLFGNMIGLWCVGEFIQKTENRGRLLAVYGGGVIAGALAWLALASQLRSDFPFPLICLGASAGVFASLTYVLLQRFNEPIQIFIYFILPVTLRSKWVLAFLVVITLGGLFFSEIPATTGWWTPSWASGVAHSAHFGGLLWGAGMFAWGQWRLYQPVRKLKRLEPFRQTVAVRPSNAYSGNDNIVHFPGSSQPPLEQEVNRILDKINATGFDSLSRTERETLEQASAVFPKK